MRKARRVPKEGWREYRRKADVLLEASSASMEYGLHDAAAVLAVHAGILLADAVLVRVAGLRSASERHEDVLGLLEAHVAKEAAPRRHLGALLQAKNQIEYTSERVEEAEAKRLVQHARRFAAWCREYLPEA